MFILMDETELLPPYPLGFTIYKDIGFAPEEYLQNLSGGCFFSLLTYALHVESSHDQFYKMTHFFSTLVFSKCLCVNFNRFVFLEVDF